MSLKERIQQTLSTKEEANRKSVSITLEADLLEKVDRVAKSFSKVTEKNFSRNSVIEEAIKEYVAEAGEVLQDIYGIDIGETSEEDTGVTEFDLAIFPAHNEGFKETFLGEDCWYSVRIKEDKVPKIKYVAVYRAAPISGITHYAKVKEIKQYQDTSKKIIYFEGTAIPLPQTVKLGDTDPNAMRAPRYTTLAKLQSANVVKDLF
jgi:predicted transcriptional regulator